jgi:hypothetical protein
MNLDEDSIARRLAELDQQTRAEGAEEQKAITLEDWKRFKDRYTAMKTVSHLAPNEEEEGGTYLKMVGPVTASIAPAGAELTDRTAWTKLGNASGIEWTHDGYRLGDLPAMSVAPGYSIGAAGEQRLMEVSLVKGAFDAWARLVLMPAWEEINRAARAAGEAIVKGIVGGISFGFDVPGIPKHWYFGRHSRYGIRYAKARRLGAHLKRVREEAEG